MSIAERIKLARKRAGMSMEDLANRAGITRQVISKYEKGQCKPGSDVLRKLAQALGVTVDFLTRPPTAELEEVRFRKLKGVGVKTQGRLEAMAQDAMERQLALERIVLGENPPPRLTTRSVPVTTPEEAEWAAETCREALRLGDEPVANLTATLERNWIRVLELPQSAKGFEGLSLTVKGELPFMIISPEGPGDRLRFTLAHESGHLLMGLPDDADHEMICNRFAGALLVPRDALIRELGPRRPRGISWRELYDLKRLYGVSMGTLIFRARDCGIITEAAANRMQQERGWRGWRTQEPGEVPRERPTLIDRLTAQALKEELIGVTRAAELSGLRTDQVIAKHQLWSDGHDPGD